MRLPPALASLLLGTTLLGAGQSPVEGKLLADNSFEATTVWSSGRRCSSVT